MQWHNRGRVLLAAREEFLAHGYRDAGIDRIAERAGLTRGAVYSNFPSKQALYFAVLAADAEQAADPQYRLTARTPAAALADFARAWVGRLPAALDGAHAAAWIGRDLMPEVIASGARTTMPFAQLTGLTAILLGMALEELGGVAGIRMVRAAEVALTTLHGAGQLAAAAPGFGDPFAVVQACARLADVDFGDAWAPAHLPYVAPARPVDEPWTPPEARDALRAEPLPAMTDGVVAVLGLHRLIAVEEAIRALPAEAGVTAVLVTGSPAELGPLARLAIADLATGLRAAVRRSAWPRLRIVHDDAGDLARSVGVAAVSDATESAARVRGGRIVARADGYGACHAAATAG